MTFDVLLEDILCFKKSAKRQPFRIDTIIWCYLSYPQGQHDKCWQVLSYCIETEICPILISFFGNENFNEFFLECNCATALVFSLKTRDSVAKTSKLRIAYDPIVIICAENAIKAGIKYGFLNNCFARSTALEKAFELGAMVSILSILFRVKVFTCNSMLLHDFIHFIFLKIIFFSRKLLSRED